MYLQRDKCGLVLKQDWTDLFDGLWQMQPRTNLMEKAFIQLMSCGNTRCCICSLLESPNPFSTFERKKLDGLCHQLEKESFTTNNSSTCSPLTVMVQRSTVKMPTSLLLACEDSQSSALSQTMLTCSQCNICVHKCQSLK